mmetsp:Transcript_41295/g.119471  ORF Transcript_41295/g.119471 Transcript_41295/m.119471 type:complete len:205 (-) Transcript_41295:1033-1647(-)
MSPDLPATARKTIRWQCWCNSGGSLGGSLTRMALAPGIFSCAWRRGATWTSSSRPRWATTARSGSCCDSLEPSSYRLHQRCHLLPMRSRQRRWSPSRSQVRSACTCRSAPRPWRYRRARKPRSVRRRRPRAQRARRPTARRRRSRSATRPRSRCWQRRSWWRRSWQRGRRPTPMRSPRHQRRRRPPQSLTPRWPTARVARMRRR